MRQKANAPLLAHPNQILNHWPLDRPCAALGTATQLATHLVTWSGWRKLTSGTKFEQVGTNQPPKPFLGIASR